MVTVKSGPGRIVFSFRVSAVSRTPTARGEFMKNSGYDHFILLSRAVWDGQRMLDTASARAAGHLHDGDAVGDCGRDRR